MDLSLSNMPSWQANISAKFREKTEPCARRRIARHAFMEPLSPGFCREDELPPHLQFAPTARSSFAPFLARRPLGANRCPAPPLSSLPQQSSSALRLAHN